MIFLRSWTNEAHYRCKTPILWSRDVFFSDQLQARPCWLRSFSPSVVLYWMNDAQSWEQTEEGCMWGVRHRDNRKSLGGYCERGRCLVVVNYSSQLVCELTSSAGVYTLSTCRGHWSLQSSADFLRFPHFSFLMSLPVKSQGGRSSEADHMSPSEFGYMEITVWNLPSGLGKVSQAEG